MSDADGENAPFFDIDPSDSFFAVAVVNNDDGSRLAVFSTDNKPVLPDDGEQIQLEKVDVDSGGEFENPNESAIYRVVSREFKYTSLSVSVGDEDGEREVDEKESSESTLLGTGISLYVEPADESA